MRTWRPELQSGWYYEDMGEEVRQVLKQCFKTLGANTVGKSVSFRVPLDSNQNPPPRFLPRGSYNTRCPCRDAALSRGMHPHFLRHDRCVVSFDISRSFVRDHKKASTSSLENRHVGTRRHFKISLSAPLADDLELPRFRHGRTHEIESVVVHSWYHVARPRPVQGLDRLVAFVREAKTLTGVLLEVVLELQSGSCPTFPFALCSKILGSGWKHSALPQALLARPRRLPGLHPITVFCPERFLL